MFTTIRKTAVAAIASLALCGVIVPADAAQNDWSDLGGEPAWLTEAHAVIDRDDQVVKQGGSAAIIIVDERPADAEKQDEAAGKTERGAAATPARTSNAFKAAKDAATKAARAAKEASTKAARAAKEASTTAANAAARKAADAASATAAAANAVANATADVAADAASASAVAAIAAANVAASKATDASIAAANATIAAAKATGNAANATGNAAAIAAVAAARAAKEAADAAAEATVAATPWVVKCTVDMGTGAKEMIFSLLLGTGEVFDPGTEELVRVQIPRAALLSWQKCVKNPERSGDLSGCVCKAVGGHTTRVIQKILLPWLS